VFRRISRWLPPPLRRRLRPIAVRLGLRKPSLAGTAGKPLPAAAPTPRANDTAAGLIAEWRLEEALDILDKQVLTADPTDQTGLQLRARALTLSGDLDAARETLQTLLRAHPLGWEAAIQGRRLGMNIAQPSRDAAWQQVLAAGMTPKAFGTAVPYLYHAGLFDDCVEFCLLGIAAIAREAKKDGRTAMEVGFRLWMAISLESMGQYERAIETFSIPLSHPRHAANAAKGLARCWLELGQPARSESILRTIDANRDGPLPFSGLALDVLQAQGKVGESYRHYRTRPASTALARFFDQPPPLDLDLRSAGYDSALFLAEGGPGDELRLSSVYEDLATLIPDVTITCDPRLAAVMRRSFPGITFLPTERSRFDFPKPITDRTLINDVGLYGCLSDGAVEVGRTKDLVCFLVDTLADVRADKEAFRAASPSPLVPDPDLRNRWRTHLDAGAGAGKLKIGLAWRSLLESVARNRHYLRVDDLAPLGALENVEFWLLQPGATMQELERLADVIDLRVPDGLHLVDDLEGQLAFASCLDAVISPFATTAELAAAVGTPTLMLSVTQSTLWRRQYDGTDVFRPNARIFRLEGDRQESMQAVIEFIAGLEPS
jgi:tetratricopeptide (TPR) repeat protein